MTILWIAGIGAPLALLSYLGLWGAFFIVGMLPDVGDYG